MNPIALIFMVLLTVYGVVNVVFAFLTAPAWLAPRLGPDRRTRALLFFLPDEAREKAGRVVYGLACLVVVGFVVWAALS